MASRKKRFTKKRVATRKAPSSCFFCKEKIEPDYKDYGTLKRVLSDRAKIIGVDRSGVCAKHQRKVTIQVKRARHLGLLPFTPTL
jgi:small subunit ribosomal protein S18